MAKKEQNKTILTPRQSQILKAVAAEEYFSRHFYLAGGTALSEFYLKHRLSEDLDFFCDRMLKSINHNDWQDFFIQEAKKLKPEIIE